MAPLEAGTYRLVVDEELVEDLSLAAYRRAVTHIEIPAISAKTIKRQFLQVSAAEIEDVLRKDAELASATATTKESCQHRGVESKSILRPMGLIRLPAMAETGT
ncbi:hypothetical protein [Agrobacterium tumefaciens]|uniref:hypothetical protein n=1 Tax=Agrobacterium tumefaciens TaxID=358 RepID=UPI002FDA9C34